MTALESAPPQALVEDLLRPQAYGVLGSDNVSLEETHISSVFLIGDAAFKVKKSVNLGFVDFRTLEARRAACEAEVLLNSRLAPSVYRGVVPIRVQQDGHCAIGGSGPTVDFAVHMRRLPESRRADQLLARGELSSERVEAVAKRIAAFHAECPRDARWGRAEIIEANLAENFEQTRDSLRRSLRAEEAEEAIRWQTEFIRTRRDLFAARMASGRIRDGHGDLRLEHVYFEDTAITIVDCIEFNERFRFADDCADVAFFSMDLAAHGRVDLAERFLAAYARESNDYDLYGVVDFYESYRAFVRGKIAGMNAANASLDERVRERASHEARRMYLLALSADRRSLISPSVVAVGGIIASGKSTVASAVGAAMSAPVIDADRTRKSMLGVDATRAIHDASWTGAYDPSFTDRVYEEVLRRAAVVLASGRPVVLDASFRSLSMREGARELARRFGVPFRFIECRADAAQCRARLLEREGKDIVSDGRLSIFDDFCARFEPMTELDRREHVVVDTLRPFEENLSVLRESLDTWPVGFSG